MKGMRNIAPFGLRMPDELREAISERAKQNGRSMNSEIVQILQDAVDNQGKLNMHFDDEGQFIKLIDHFIKDYERTRQKAIDEAVGKIPNILTDTKKPT